MRWKLLIRGALRPRLWRFSGQSAAPACTIGTMTPFLLFSGLGLLGAGGAAVIGGLRLLLLRPRPASLGGMVLAPLGLLAFYAGLVRLLASP